VPAPNRFFFLLMSSVPSDLSLLRLPRGESVVYPTGRPSIRLVMCEIAALGYEVSGFSLHQTDDLRPLTPGVWHWAVVIGEIREIIYLLSFPRRRRRQSHRRPIRFRTKAATCLHTMSSIQTTSIRTFHRTAIATDAKLYKAEPLGTQPTLTSIRRSLSVLGRSSLR
jgi:hypothetical protein